MTAICGTDTVSFGAETTLLNCAFRDRPRAARSSTSTRTGYVLVRRTTSTSLPGVRCRRPGALQFIAACCRRRSAAAVVDAERWLAEHAAPEKLTVPTH